MNRQVQYQPRTAFVSGQSAYVKHAPSNGSTFIGGTSDGSKPSFLEFRIRGDDFVSGAAIFNCTFTAKPVVGAGGAPATFNCFSNGSLQCGIRTLEVLNPGGGLIERVDDYGRQFSVLSSLGTNVEQMGISASAYDLYADIGEKAATTAYSGGRATGMKLNTSAAANPPVTLPSVECSVPLSLSSVFGPEGCGGKMLPLCMLDGDITLRIYLTPVWQEMFCTYAPDRASANGAGDASSFELSKCSLSLNHVRYNAEDYDRITSMIRDAGRVEWDVVQYISSTADIGYSSEERVLLGNTSYRDVKSMYSSRYFPTMSPSYVFNCSQGNGEYEAVYEINGERIRGTPLGNGVTSNVVTAVSPFAMSAVACSRSASDIGDSNSQLLRQNRIGVSSSVPGTTGRSAGYTNLNGVTIHPDIYTATVGSPAAVPNQTAATLTRFGQDNRAIDGYFWATGFDTSENEPGTGHHRRGRDCVGKQCVYVSRQLNQIPSASTNCRLLSIFVIGAKMILDMTGDRDRGELRCERA